MAVRRWRFTDSDGNVYIVPTNPAEMTSPFATKQLTVKQTTALIGGRVLITEGPTVPVEWSFGGITLDKAHYEALRHWVLEVEGRIIIRDHYGRDIICFLTSFDATPKRSVGKYWRHDYRISGTVFYIGPTTVAEDGSDA